MANSEDSGEMQHNAAFHQGLHCSLLSKQSSWTEVRHNLQNSTRDPLKYKMDSPILIVSIHMGNPLEYKGLNSHPYLKSRREKG